MNYAEKLIDFIEKSPVSFQAAANAAALLSEAGFEELAEDQRWSIAPGGKYYVVRNDSALIAFAVPESFNSVHIAAAHTDSPYFKIKENPEISRGGSYAVLNVEKYGGMLQEPWFDRPLSVAGRIIVKEEGRLVSKLIDFKKDMLIIPSIAIHMDREANEGRKKNPQEDMLPLYGLCGEGSTPDLMQEAADLAGVGRDDILGSDLFVYNRQKGTIWGNNGEFVSAPRLDDLQCVFSGLTGFIAGKKEKALSVFAALDNEEVGSSTRQGAASGFLKDTLHRIYNSLCRDFEQYQTDLANGFMLSMDNAHALHPNYLAKADPVNRPVIGGGVVLKFSGNQKYCTDGYSAAVFREICSCAGKKLQVFTNRSDIPGGSTLGNISNNQVAIPSADIGIAQLAMHSPFETAGTSDTKDMAEIAEAFFS
ncbi:MAG: M18 family aminopeptidase [Lachnospiraceae bacterium]|nr:M18 family aminopeptidase [Lachnospiraceae bacterium]